MSPRRFPPPWSIEDIDAAFVVKDGSGQKVAYVYYAWETAAVTSVYRRHYRHRYSEVGASRCRYRFRWRPHLSRLRRRHSLHKKIYCHLDNSRRRRCHVVSPTCNRHHNPSNRRYSLTRRLTDQVSARTIIPRTYRQTATVKTKTRC